MSENKQATAPPVGTELTKVVAKPFSEWTQEEIDEELFQFERDNPDPGEECGRWSNGRLTNSCSKAGSEECDFECPYR